MSTVSKDTSLVHVRTMISGIAFQLNHAVSGVDQAKEEHRPIALRNLRAVAVHGTQLLWSVENYAGVYHDAALNEAWQGGVVKALWALPLVAHGIDAIFAGVEGPLPDTIEPHDPPLVVAKGVAENLGQWVEEHDPMPAAA